MSFASEIQAMHSADRHLRMCGPFFKATVSKSRRRWLLVTASCVCISTLNSMFLILPRRSDLLAGDVAGGVRRLSAETTAIADHAPQATLKANCRRMVVSYGIVAEVTGPSCIDLQVRTYYVSFPPEFRPEFLSPEFRTKLILPWNDLIPACVSTESRNAAELRGFRKMTPGRNRNRKKCTS